MYGDESASDEIFNVKHFIQDNIWQEQIEDRLLTLSIIVHSVRR